MFLGRKDGHNRRIMTKRDYKIIAGVLLRVEGLEDRQHARLVTDFCVALKKDNPNFDADKFKLACGME
jgi:hypothetical protein